MSERDLIIYRGPDGVVRTEVRFEDETFWLSQKQMAELFGVEVHTIIHHLNEIFASGELREEATTRKIRVVRTEGNREVSREITHYALDAIISVGYRVNSLQATRFRIWATQTLKEIWEAPTPDSRTPGDVLLGDVKWMARGIAVGEVLA